MTKPIKVVKGHFSSISSMLGYCKLLHDELSATYVIIHSIQSGLKTKQKAGVPINHFVGQNPPLWQIIVPIVEKGKVVRCGQWLKNEDKKKLEEPGFGRRHFWTPPHACETDHSSLVGWDDTEKTTNDERKDYVADWRWHREDQKRKHRLRCGLGMTRTRPDQVAADGFLVRTWWGMIGEWGGKDLKINNICHGRFCWNIGPYSCIDQMPLVDRNQSKTAWEREALCSSES